ncbi:MAG: hypothetical protein WAU32_04755 [Thermoanaerobaculia bacterium]
MRPASRLQRLAGGFLLLAAFAASGSLHHHEDLGGALLPGSGSGGLERVVSSHSPLSKAAHWHSGVRVKDDPCLACSVQRAVGMPASTHFVEPSLAAVRAADSAAAVSGSFARLPLGSRAPPALL